MTRRQALDIPDRWEQAMNNPHGPPLEVHHADLQVIREAIPGGGSLQSRKPRTPDQPIMTVGVRTLNLTRTLLAELQEHEHITLVVEDGKPIIRPNPEGWKVVPYSHGHGGMITSPTLFRRAQKYLGEETRWLMERQGNEWRGTAQIRNP